MKASNYFRGRALRRLQRESPSSPLVFVSERGSPFTTAGFARMIERAAAGAGPELRAHPHMLRHAGGYALANKGHDNRAIQDWLGHRSITSTAAAALRAAALELWESAPTPSWRSVRHLP
jgi:site-specific recombinase XerD